MRAKPSSENFASSLAASLRIRSELAALDQDIRDRLGELRAPGNCHVMAMTLCRWRCRRAFPSSAHGTLEDRRGDRDVVVIGQPNQTFAGTSTMATAAASVLSFLARLINLTKPGSEKLAP